MRDSLLSLPLARFYLIIPHFMRATLAAGKLNALLERDVSRDIYDSHQLLTNWPLDVERMRLAFTIYAAMRKHSWRNITIDKVKDIRDKLIPVLKGSEAPDTRFPAVDGWTRKMVGECKSTLADSSIFNANKIILVYRSVKIFTVLNCCLAFISC